MQAITHALLKKPLDDGRVHRLVLVHLADLGANNVLGEALDWRNGLNVSQTSRSTRRENRYGPDSRSIFSSSVKVKSEAGELGLIMASREKHRIGLIGRVHGQPKDLDGLVRSRRRWPTARGRDEQRAGDRGGRPREGAGEKAGGGPE